MKYFNKNNYVNTINLVIALLIFETIFSINTPLEFNSKNLEDFEQVSKIEFINNLEIFPVISDFHIKNSHPNRLYFKSNKVITATTIKGFIISGKIISSVKINIDKMDGHYFTVFGSFSFWDNSTIRYEGGSNLKDLVGDPLRNFNLRYVENNIEEPSAHINTYYVSLEGNDSSNGLTEGSAWRTINKAAQTVTKGSTVWIKAGDYGDENIIVANSGTVKYPIKFIGYKTNKGDTVKLERTPTISFDSAEMPYIHTRSTLGNGFDLNNGDYIIVRNIQVEGYYSGIDFKANNSVLDNVYVKNSSHYNIDMFDYSIAKNRVIDSYLCNSGNSGIRLSGSSHLIDNLYVCSYDKPGMDYYISLYGGKVGVGNHIIRNCEVVRDPKDTHTGHGISVKAGGRDLHYTLIENCTIHNISQAIELRHSQSKFTIVRNVRAVGNGNKASNLVTFRDDTSYNTIENCYADRVNVGVKFTMNAKEDKGIQSGGHHNKIINTVFNNTKYILSVGGFGGKPLKSTNNEFLNCTFYGSKFMYSLLVDFDNTNKFTNCIFAKVNSELLNDGISSSDQSYNNYFDCGVWADKYIGISNNISVNPRFRNETKGYFDLTEDTPKIVRRGGIMILELNYDKNMTVRIPPFSMGAFQ